MTIDQLALATEKEFQIIHKEIRAMREEFVTKAEFKEFKDEVLGAIRDLTQIVARMDAQLSAFMARTNEDISKLQAADRDFDVRLRVVEKRG
jgi:hypothetical protein